MFPLQFMSIYYLYCETYYYYLESCQLRRNLYLFLRYRLPFNIPQPVADTGDGLMPTEAVSTGERIEGWPLTDETDNQSDGLPEIFLRLMYMPPGTIGIISQSFHPHSTMLAQSSLANTLAPVLSNSLCPTPTEVLALYSQTCVIAQFEKPM